MTSFLTRFVDLPDLASTYDDLFGRAGVIDSLRALPTGTGQREQAAVDQYCESLKVVCGFRYVSQAVIMDAAKDRIRYFFVFATNSIHGIEVFKEAEAAAAVAQDEVRHETRFKKKSQFGLPFDDRPPRTARLLGLHKQYVDRMQVEILVRLATARQNIWYYDELYGQAMTLPLVTRSDFDRALLELEPNVKVRLNGQKRRKAALHKGDRIEVINRNVLRT